MKTIVIFFLLFSFTSNLYSQDPCIVNDLSINDKISQDSLAQLAQNDPCYQVRVKAVLYLENQKLLAKISKDDNDCRLRSIALIRLKNIVQKATILNQELDSSVIISVFNVKSTDDKILYYYIARNLKFNFSSAYSLILLTSEIRTKLIENDSLLLDIIKNAVDIKNREYAYNLYYKYQFWSDELKRFVAIKKANLEFICINYIKDIRDGQLYKSIRIGNQWWLAENLNYKTNDGSWVWEKGDMSVNRFVYNSNNDKISDSSEIINKSSNEMCCGRLYNWITATNVCPAGWHLPNVNEWKELEVYLKTIFAINDNETKNKIESVFNAKLCGSYNNDHRLFMYVNINGYFWTSTEIKNEDKASVSVIEFNSLNINFKYYDLNKTDGFSVRCIKDE